jgi:4-amino-4-deoxy-L-arabinose transferase-like glycosyltransferase
MPAIALLAGVVALALFVRFWSLDWQLPFAFHPDEGHYVWKAEEMFRDGDLNPRYFRNPSLFTYVILGELKAAELLGLVQPRADPADGIFRAPSIYIYLGRATSAGLGALSVVLAFGLGKQLWGAAVGLLASAFLALNFLHVRDSHYATNDVPAVALVLASVWYSSRALMRPSLGHFALAALAGGLATSAKYSMGLFLLPIAISWLVARGERWSTGRRLASLPAAGVASLLGYLAGTPYTLLAWDKFRADFLVQMRLGGEGWEGQSSASVPQLYLDTLVTGIGWPLMVLASIGAMLGLRRDWRLALVLLAFPVGYGLFMARQQLFFARFALPLTPFFAVFGAYAILEIARCARDQRTRFVSGLILALVAVIPSGIAVVMHNVLISRPDTRAQAFEWMSASFPPRTKLGIEDYTIRDRRPRAYLDDGRVFDTDLINVNEIRDPATVLGGNSFVYVVTSSFNSDRFTSDPQRFPRQNAFYQALDQQARLVAEFRPGRDGTAITFDIEDLYTPFWGLDRYERMGPTIRIYALR